MKRSDVARAVDLTRDRAKLAGLLVLVEQGKVAIVIGQLGTYSEAYTVTDREILEATKYDLVPFLKRQITDVDAKLQALGVDPE